MDYRDMTIWALKQEKAKIEEELARRAEMHEAVLNAIQMDAKATEPPTGRENAKD